MKIIDLNLLKWLEEKKIKYIRYSHPAVYTVEQAKEYTSHIPGMHCKNLFLYCSKPRLYFLVTLPAEKAINLLGLSKELSLKKLSFCKKEDLQELLHLEPGSVSPLGLINDLANRVTYIIDKNVWDAERVCFHPNINTETLEILQKDFHAIIKNLGNKYELMEF